MKFGKVIRKAILACPPDWEDYWMDYKNFKSIICSIVEEKKKMEEAIRKTEIFASKLTETSLEKEKLFFGELSERVIKVDNFFKKIQLRYVTDVKLLIGDVTRVDSCEKDKIEETIELLLDRCRALHEKLLLLEMFAHVNYCGFTKITKKHDRVTGYVTQKKYMQKKVNKTSFSSFTLLRNSVRIVEDQYIVLSKCLSSIKTIPPIKGSSEIKEVNESLDELDKKADNDR